MRDRKNKTPTEKTAALRITHSLTKETLQLMNREKVFPKKARWQICYELAEIVNKYHTCVMFANGINVDCHALFVLRHINVACAQAWPTVRKRVSSRHPPKAVRSHRGRSS